jgi:hypothetical protein
MSVMARQAKRSDLPCVLYSRGVDQDGGNEVILTMEREKKKESKEQAMKKEKAKSSTLERPVSEFQSSAF